MVAAVTAMAFLTACAETETVVSEDEAIVQRVADGDSLVLEGGDRVRLLQIDAPELGEGECYGREALRELERILQPADAIVLEADPQLDRVDRYRRLLRYVLSADTNVNVELVRRGAATPYFRRGTRGRHADTPRCCRRRAGRRPGAVGCVRRVLEAEQTGRDAPPLAPLPRPRDV